MAESVYQDLKIVDLTMGWAGPLATMIFADFGAEVVKIEGPGRLDWWRAGSVSRLPADYSKRDQRNWERSSLFNGVNRNKYDVVLDMGDERGRTIFRRLVARADVVVESFTPRVMRNWGLDYESLREINPRIIMMSLPGVGLVGPWSHYVGYASTTEAMSGMPALCGYDGGPRLQTPFIADPVGGLNGAAALSLALYHRELTGEGQRIEVAQFEGMIPLIGTAMMDYAMNQRVWDRVGNGDNSFAPNGAFPCAGADRWVVVCAKTDDEWRNLCSAIGREDLLHDPSLASIRSRSANADRINEAVGAWTLQRNPREAMEVLQSWEVLAGAVNTAADLLDDPQVAAAGSFTDIDHPVVGPHPYPNITVHLSENPGEVRLPSPTFGEHNDYVFGDLLGIGPVELNELRESGIVADLPVVSS